MNNLAALNKCAAKQIKTIEEALKVLGDLNRQRGQTMRELRERNGVSLRELARRLGISAPFLSDMELGRRTYSAEWCEKALRAFSKERLKEFLTT